MGALSAAVHAGGLLKEAAIIFHHLHHSLASGQTTGREHSPAHQQKIVLKVKQNNAYFKTYLKTHKTVWY